MNAKPNVSFFVVGRSKLKVSKTDLKIIISPEILTYLSQSIYTTQQIKCALLICCFPAASQPEDRAKNLKCCLFAGMRSARREGLNKGHLYVLFGDPLPLQRTPFLLSEKGRCIYDGRKPYWSSCNYR